MRLDRDRQEWTRNIIYVFIVVVVLFFFSPPSDIRSLFTPPTSMANQGEKGIREDAKSARSSHNGRGELEVERRPRE